MFEPGTVLDGKYRIVRLLGEGGMGAVFEAEHEAIRRQVAIKVLFPGFAHEPDSVLRFHREAHAAGRVGHDNICEVTDIGRLPWGSPYLVMPLLKGQPLATLIAREAPLPVDRAANIAAQVLDALGAAHAAGIVHRDIKPDPVVVTVELQGYRTFRQNVVPSEDRVVYVQMRRAGSAATTSAAAVSGSAQRDAGTADAARSGDRTIGGRLGTTVDPNYDESP